MLYDHIEYNGIAYYLAGDQHSRPSDKFSNEQVPVYLVIGKQARVDYKNVYYASKYVGYEGEEEEIYLFFDSALRIRGDYLTATD